MTNHQPKPPYLMTRHEWQEEREKTRIGHGQANYTKASKSQEIARMARLDFLLFGIGEWIYRKACEGEEWALEALEYPTYDRHKMVLRKAEEEGLINTQTHNQ